MKDEQDKAEKLFNQKMNSFPEIKEKLDKIIDILS